MPFKRKSSALATTATITAEAQAEGQAAQSQGEAPAQSEPSAPSYELDVMIDAFCDEILNSGVGVMDLPVDNEILEAGMIDGLKAVAQRMGCDYDPATVATFGMYEKKDGGVVVTTPKLVSPDGQRVVLQWGGIEHEIDGVTPLRGSKDWLVKTERVGNNERANLLFGPGRPGKPGTLNFPVAMIINEEHRDDQGDISVLNTFGELAEFLGSIGSSLLSFSDLEDGSEFIITGYELKTSSKGNEYGVLSVEADGEAADFFAPGQADDWEGVSFPAKAVKQGYVLQIEGHGEISTGGFLSYADLEVGKSYKVTGFILKMIEGTKGSFPVSTLHVDLDGKTVPVSGSKTCRNYTITKTLMQPTFGGIASGEKQECDATLIVDKLISLDDSNKVLLTVSEPSSQHLIANATKLKAVCRLQSNDSRSSSLRKKLAAFNKANAA